MKYREDLKSKARKLRNSMTEEEIILWQHLRKKQILDTQFFRQKPVENYIVDFYAPTIKLVIELDGGQHFEKDQEVYDEKRTRTLNSLGLTVLRFTNSEVKTNLEGMLEAIFSYIDDYKKSL